MSTSAEAAAPGLRKPAISAVKNGPLSAVSNSPPPPPPTALRLLLRRRRRSDLLLAAIGGLICLVSGFHVALHSRHVHAGPGAAGAGHAVRAKLDAFQDGAGRLSRRAERMKRLGGRGGEAGRRRDGKDGAPEVVAGDAAADGPRNGAKSETGRVADEPPHEQHGFDPQGKVDADRQKGPKKADARRASPGGPSDGHIPHPVAHLSCHDHGGPSDEKIVDEMVFWSDVPSDADYLSPMHPSVDPRTDSSVERYLTFEPDHGGWNNIRMAMETALVMGHATGRTLVLPPEQRMYLIDKGRDSGQQTYFGFNDFFHLDAISIEHKGFKVITMDEFLAREGVTGRLQDYATNATVYPPRNETNYGSSNNRLNPLWKYLRQVGNTPTWDPWECALAIPSSTDESSVAELRDTVERVMAGEYGGKPKPTLEEFNGNPVPVDAPLGDRMREMLADRPGICVYDRPLQEAKLLHLKVDKGVRLLTHFYAFVFFADWRQDVWSKRFVRDHLRYVDDIMCAAARVIEKVREHARGNTRHEPSRLEGVYDAAHIRRGGESGIPCPLLSRVMAERVARLKHKPGPVAEQTSSTRRHSFRPRSSTS